MEEGRAEIGRLLAPLVSLEARRVEELLEIPPDPEMGDLAFPCFVPASREKKAPAAIAANRLGVSGTARTTCSAARDGTGGRKDDTIQRPSWRTTFSSREANQTAFSRLRGE